MGTFGLRVCHYLAVAVALYVVWLITACTTVTGPCVVEMGGSRITCEQGGGALLIAPGRAIRKAGKAAESAPAPAPKETPPPETQGPPGSP